MISLHFFFSFLMSCNINMLLRAMCHSRKEVVKFSLPYTWKKTCFLHYSNFPFQVKFSGHFNHSIWSFGPSIIVLSSNQAFGRLFAHSILSFFWWTSIMLLHSMIFWSSLCLYQLTTWVPPLEMILVQSLMIGSNSLASKWKFVVFPSSSRRRISKSRAYVESKIECISLLGNVCATWITFLCYFFIISKYPYIVMK